MSASKKRALPDPQERSAVRQPVRRFWLQPTAKFPLGAPQRESYDSNAAFDQAAARYADAWRAAYRCLGCDDAACPQCGA